MTDLKYPDRNVLPILSGESVQATLLKKSCPAKLLKKLPHVSSAQESAGLNSRHKEFL